ncbi:uncharacterized protein [Diadema antillarum]|uniref:uncharacterized protein n=1 Tax=Diadema antillarum TaxID=105358 RepID=UPI003A839F47
MADSSQTTPAPPAPQTGVVVAVVVVVLVIGAIAVAIGIWYYRYRKKRSHDLYDEESEDNVSTFRSSEAWEDAVRRTQKQKETTEVEPTPHPNMQMHHPPDVIVDTDKIRQTDQYDRLRNDTITSDSSDQRKVPEADEGTQSPSFVNPAFDTSLDELLDTSLFKLRTPSISDDPGKPQFAKSQSASTSDISYRVESETASGHVKSEKRPCNEQKTSNLLDRDHAVEGSSKPHEFRIDMREEPQSSEKGDSVLFGKEQDTNSNLHSVNNAVAKRDDVSSHSATEEGSRALQNVETITSSVSAGRADTPLEMTGDFRLIGRQTVDEQSSDRLVKVREEAENATRHEDGVHSQRAHSYAEAQRQSNAMDDQISMEPAGVSPDLLVDLGDRSQNKAGEKNVESMDKHHLEGTHTDDSKLPTGVSGHPTDFRVTTGNWLEGDVIVKASASPEVTKLSPDDMKDIPSEDYRELTRHDGMVISSLSEGRIRDTKFAYDNAAFVSEETHSNTRHNPASENSDPDPNPAAILGNLPSSDFKLREDTKFLEKTDDLSDMINDSILGSHKFELLSELAPTLQKLNFDDQSTTDERTEKYDHPETMNAYHSLEGDNSVAREDESTLRFNEELGHQLQSEEKANDNICSVEKGDPETTDHRGSSSSGDLLSSFSAISDNATENDSILGSHKLELLSELAPTLHKLNFDDQSTTDERTEKFDHTETMKGYHSLEGDNSVAIGDESTPSFNVALGHTLQSDEKANDNICSEEKDDPEAIDHRGSSSSGDLLSSFSAISDSPTENDNRPVDRVSHDDTKIDSHQGADETVTNDCDSMGQDPTTSHEHTDDEPPLQSEETEELHRVPGWEADLMAFDDHTSIGNTVSLSDLNSNFDGLLQKVENSEEDIGTPQVCDANSVDDTFAVRQDNTAGENIATHHARDINSADDSSPIEQENAKNNIEIDEGPSLETTQMNEHTLNATPDVLCSAESTVEANRDGDCMDFNGRSDLVDDSENTEKAEAKIPLQDPDEISDQIELTNNLQSSNNEEQTITHVDDPPRDDNSTGLSLTEECLRESQISSPPDGDITTNNEKSISNDLNVDVEKQSQNEEKTEQGVLMETYDPHSGESSEVGPTDEHMSIGDEEVSTYLELDGTHSSDDVADDVADDGTELCSREDGDGCVTESANEMKVQTQIIDSSDHISVGAKDFDDDSNHEVDDGDDNVIDHDEQEPAESS